MDYNELAIIRPISEKDLKGFYQLALLAGIGMTSLPKDNDLLSGKIKKSLISFKNLTDNIDDYLFLFVLERLKDKKIIGCSGIVSVGTELEPAYYLKYNPKNLSVCLESQYQGSAELCSLFLSKDFRKNDNGKLLSRSRLMFISLNKIFDNKKIIAEMRGYFDENNKSPFWKDVFKNKFNINSEEIVKLRASGNKKKIIDLIGFKPIDISNIPKSTIDLIGEVHNSTKAARALLEKEGLRFNNYIDLIDAGPALEANTNSLKTIKEMKLYKVKSFEHNSKLKNNKKYIISNDESINFRACITEAKIINKEHIQLPEIIKSALKLETNSIVRVVEV